MKQKRRLESWATWEGRRDLDGKGIIIVVGTKGAEDVLEMGGNGYGIVFDMHTVRVRRAVIMIHRYIKVQRTESLDSKPCRHAEAWLSLKNTVSFPCCGTSSSLNESQHIPCSLSQAT
jgi:hypothetical protein